MAHIAVLSDDRLFCESVLRVLSSEPTFTAVAYDDGATSSAMRNRKHDIAILDARVSGALIACAELADGKLRVILVGAPEDDVWAEEALGAGARGIVVRTSNSEDIVKAIRVAQDGGIWARRRWLNARVQRVAAVKPKPPAIARLNARLSRREREVLRYAAMGIRNKELADRLAISEATVKVHLTHIFKKLGVCGRAELAAVYHGLRTPAAPSPRASGLKHSA